MTVNGWLQILLFLGVVLAVTAPLGRFMTRVFNRERTWLDPVLPPDRAADLSADRRRRDARDALDRVRRRDAALQRRVDAGAVPDAARAAVAAVEPAGLRRRRAGPRVQHRRVVHDEHELAGLQRRVDDELSDADGRPRVPQLRVGRDRHRAGDRVHPRHRAEGKGHARQLLGRPGPLPRCGCCCRSASSARWCSCRRASCRTCGRTTRSPSSIRRPSRRPARTASRRHRS